MSTDECDLVARRHVKELEGSDVANFVLVLTSLANLR
jgi:hypothetical protein